MSPALTLPTASLRPKEERRLLRGHCWVYRNELAQVPALEDGSLVDVYSDTRRFVGRGFFQAEGGIGVRLLSRHQEPVDEAFFAARLDTARAFREQCFPESQTYRWIYGESDGLPGLVADRYGALVSLQSTCAFYGAWMEALAALILRAPGVSGVLFRLHETVTCFGEVPESAGFDLEGFALELNPRAVQKTGLFLDQRWNRRAIEPFAKGRRVFDGHCHHGLWSLHAARAGAESVVGVDSSAPAIAQAERNAARNGVDAVCRFECARVEEALASGERYGLVIIDPPALAKSRAQADKALPRYTALNKAALEAVEPGGFLATSSCSHFVDLAMFQEAIKRAASASGRHCAIVETRGAAPDHPVLLAMPETAYLKCLLLRVE